MTNPTDALTAVPDAEWQQKYVDLRLHYESCAISVGDDHAEDDDVDRLDAARTALDWHVLTRQPAVAPQSLLMLLAEAERTEVAASRMVAGLCDGSRRWQMCIPPDRKNDADMVIGDALASLRALIAALRTEPAAVAPKAHESLVAELQLNDPLGPIYQIQLAADVLAGEVPEESFDVRALAAHLGGLAYKLKAAALRTPAPTCAENAENYTRSGDMLSEHTRSAPTGAAREERGT